MFYLINGQLYAMTSEGLVSFLDKVASGQSASPDDFGVDVGAFCGDLSDLPASQASVLAQSVRAGLVAAYGSAPEPVEAVEFAQRVVEACEEEAAALLYENSLRVA